MSQTKCFDVTHMTPQQRRQLLQQCMAQSGFKAFIKNQNNHQTHYHIPIRKLTCT